MRKLLFIFLLAPIITFGQQFKLKDPGAWSMTTKHRSDSTRLAINGHGIIKDTMTVQITCNPRSRTIRFDYLTGWMAGDSLVIPYVYYETWQSSGQDPRYLKDSYYYHTAGYGDVELHPKEMVVINDPLSHTRLEFY